jgi:hypothetical protein
MMLPCCTMHEEDGQMVELAKRKRDESKFGAEDAVSRKGDDEDVHRPRKMLS